MPWTYTLALYLPVWSCSPSFLPCTGSCWEEDQPPCLREAKEEETAGCWSYDLAEPASVPKEICCFAGWFFCTLLLFWDMNKLFCQKPFSLSLLPSSNCRSWRMNTRWQSFTASCSLSQRGALVSASSSCCMFDTINCVSNRVPDTCTVVSETASQPASELSVLAVLFGAQVPVLLQELLQSTLLLRRPQLESGTHFHSSRAASVLSCVFKHMQDYIWPKISLQGQIFHKCKTT